MSQHLIKCVTKQENRRKLYKTNSYYSRSLTGSQERKKRREGEIEREREQRTKNKQR